VRHRARFANLPIRMATGAFLVNAGLTKLKADKEEHERVHGFASGTYPMFQNMAPDQFTMALGASEVALGGALLSPFAVGDALAGLGLTTFASGLMGLYAQTPGMRQEGSVRPTQKGIPLAKDIWLVGIGATLLLSGLTTRRINRLERKATRRGRKGAKAAAAGAAKVATSAKDGD
jgi:hypothetical protein